MSLREQKKSHVNKIIHLYEKCTTATNIKFYREKNEVSNESIEKNFELFKEILQVN